MHVSHDLLKGAVMIGLLRRAAAWVLSLLVVLALIPFGAVPASASGPPSCYGVSCDNVNPSDTNCVDDAYTLMSREATSDTGQSLGLLELRYSPKCHSNWVRFSAWSGVRAWIQNGLAGAEADGLPWIWRLGVPNSLRGEAGHSSFLAPGVTHWTSMVTADGTTCSSVGLYETEMSQSGGGDRRSLGAYNAPCVS